MVGFSIIALHQIELSSRCNLKCRYCPSKDLERPKMDMEWATFEKCLDWARYFALRGTQRELNLAGIGESTIHPMFARMVVEARRVLPGVDLTLATNGVELTEEVVREIAPTGIKVWVSLHRPEKAGPAVELLKRYRLLHGVSADPSIAAMDWAGQVKWHISAPVMHCTWVRDGRVFAMADGRVSPCCLDASGTDGVLGTVFDDLSRMETRPYSLCRTCNQHLCINGHDQWAKEEACVG